MKNLTAKMTDAFVILANEDSVIETCWREEMNRKREAQKRGR